MNALQILIARCNRVDVNIVQSDNRHRTRPTEWQYVIWLEKEKVMRP